MSKTMENPLNKGGVQNFCRNIDSCFRWDSKILRGAEKCFCDAMTIKKLLHLIISVDDLPGNLAFSVSHFKHHLFLLVVVEA